MKLVKSITYNRAIEISNFSLLKKKLEKHISTSIDSPICKKGDISKLNYFLIIDYKDISKEVKSQESEDSNLLLFGNKENNDKFINHIKKKNSEPFYFKKLGIFNEINGCFLVATTKNNVKNIGIYNTQNTVSCKIDLKNLPKEIKIMCNDYERKSLNKQDFLDEPNFSNIFNLSLGERNDIIENIVKSLMSINIPMPNVFPLFNDFSDIKQFSGNNIQDIIENKIDEISDINFLEQVMEISIEEENFELCSKIRDRIKEISEK